MQNKQQFHNQYVVSTSKIAEPPLLYRLLKRFETHRYTTVSEQIFQKGGAVLDIGCGGGDFLFSNQKHFSKISGVDLLAESIQKARAKKWLVPTEFTDLDAGNTPLPFLAKSFDLVTSLATLQYLSDLELVFQEVQRVLKPGGYFVFEAPNFLVIWRRVQLFFGEYPYTSQFHEGWDGGVIHYFTQQRVTKFCTAQNFVVKKVVCSGILANLRSLMPSLLGANLIFVCQKK